MAITATKGIRVNHLAKELGVGSQAILEKLRNEGLGDKAPNHMSTIPTGLAQSVREWFSGANLVLEKIAPIEKRVLKSIRVNLLAKQLGVESKVILEKLRIEGLGEKAPNHMSTISPNLVELVLDWFGKNKAISAIAVPKSAGALAVIPHQANLTAARGSAPSNRNAQHIQSRQEDFEAHLRDAKQAEVNRDRKNQDRHVAAALIAQAAVFEGYISVLYKKRRPAPPSPQRLSLWEKVDTLCEIARKKGTSIKCPRFPLRKVRNSLCHPDQDDIAVYKMPSPSEVESEEAAINKFCEALRNALV